MVESHAHLIWIPKSSPPSHLDSYCVRNTSRHSFHRRPCTNNKQHCSVGLADIDCDCSMSADCNISVPLSTAADASPNGGGPTYHEPKTPAKHLSVDELRASWQSVLRRECPDQRIFCSLRARRWDATQLVATVTNSLVCRCRDANVCQEATLKSELRAVARQRQCDGGKERNEAMKFLRRLQFAKCVSTA
ncbi:hypothetical protein GGR57DRAFT_372692 [Xylariaceae sp. FL1272]|nr:hypothetical protein GGR57DRAFT_372692 [Xylariaceae sp. FL1272]